MRTTNNYNLPDSLYSALCNDLYVKHGHISVTGLIQPPRIRQLTHRYAEYIEEDAADGIWRLLGSAVHDVLSRADTHNSLLEERLYMDCLGWKVTGQADLWESPGTLSDYKVTSVWAAIGGVKPEWESQLNIYAALYQLANFPVHDAQIICIYRDWSRGRAKQGGDYPRIPAGVMPVRLWSHDDTMQYVSERVQAHRIAEDLSDQYLPHCTPDERWEKPTTWAVMKEGRKSAVRVLDTQEMAEELLATKDSKHYLQERPGESIRCADYCNVNRWCDQYQEASRSTKPPPAGGGSK